MDIFTIVTGRISLPDPGLTAFFVYFSLLLLTFLSIAKVKEKGALLDFNETQQLKGLAVLLVVLGHLEIYVLEKPNYIPHTAPWGLAVFAVLSGYGLERSHHMRRSNLSQFTKRRINRLFIPYWIAALFFIILDYYILSKTYSLKFIIRTLLGINFDVPMNPLYGGIRWFITFILFYYCVFFLSTCFQNKITRILFLFAVPTVVCFLDPLYKVLGFVPDAQNRFYDLFCLFPHKYYNPWRNFFLLFPCGCVLGMSYESIMKACGKIPKTWWKLILLTVLSVCACIFVSEITEYLISCYKIFKTIILYKLIVSIFVNIKWIFIVLSVILMFSFLRSFSLYSRFLYLLGLLSYEIFLLHSSFVNKYDFVFHRMPPKYAFFIFLMVICCLSYGLKKGSSYVARTVSFFSHKKP